LAKKLHIAVPKSKDAKYAITQHNRDVRVARIARNLAKAAAARARREGATT
jgi:hypothetical protein